MNFNDFFYWGQFELLAEGLDDHQPKDGHWIRQGQPEYANGPPKWVYGFNVDGDDCGSDPCYKVFAWGDPDNHDKFSFGFDRSGDYGDQNKGVGLDVFKGVLKAYSEFIQTKKPKIISWNARQKTTPNSLSGKVTNPHARADIYKGWSVRYLFPDKYVPLNSDEDGKDHGKWVRRDVYDQEFVTQGYPSIPEEVTENTPSGIKLKVLDELKEKINQKIKKDKADAEAAEQERQRQEEERQRAEAERERQEAAERERQRQEILQQALESPEENPNKIKIGDVAFVIDDPNKVGRISNLSMGTMRSSWGRPQFSNHLQSQMYNAEQPVKLYAHFYQRRDENDHNFESGEGTWYLAKELRPETDEEKSNRESSKQRAFDAAMIDPEKNPNGVKVDDQIITFMPENLVSNQNGLLGKIKEIEINHQGSLFAKIDWDDHAISLLGYRHSHSVSLEHLHKDTPEKRQQIKQAKRNHEIETQIAQNRDRLNRRQGLENNYTPPENLEQLINSPSNPKHFKPGDYVKFPDSNWRYRGKRGVIVKLEPWYNDLVIAYVKFHGSRARPVQIYDLTDDKMEIDDSPDVARMRQQAQQIQARHDRLATAQRERNLIVGDTVTVGSGLHRGKTGRILSFKNVGQNISAVIAIVTATETGSITVNLRSLTKQEGPTTTESYSFFQYYLNREME